MENLFNADFWNNFFSNALSSLVASAIFAIVVYILIDSRLKRKDDVKAARYVLLVLEPLVKSLDYHLYWAEKTLNAQKDVLIGSGINIFITAPPCFYQDVLQDWERAKNEYVLKTFEPETIYKIDKILALYAQILPDMEVFALSQNQQDFSKTSTVDLRKDILDELIPILEGCFRKRYPIWKRSVSKWRKAELKKQIKHGEYLLMADTTKIRLIELEKSMMENDSWIELDNKLDDFKVLAWYHVYDYDLIGKYARLKKKKEELLGNRYGTGTLSGDG